MANSALNSKRVIRLSELQAREERKNREEELNGRIERRRKEVL